MPDPQHDVSMRAARRVGATVGKYRLERLIGIGGMAAVYAGVHRNGNRVAVKYLHERLLHDADAIVRFRREAYVANSIGHAGAVPVLDDDVDQDGGVFLVMPLLEGETVRARWERMEKRLPVIEAIAIAAHTLDVLVAAHAKRVVHRDIKPENLFLTTAAQLRVLDFGIARLLDPVWSTSITSSGHAMGTPAFMAPEQALGRARDVDARTDVWAVGATLFTLLTGRYVHEAETAGELVVYAATRSARLVGELCPELHLAIQRVVDRALAFEREGRWSDAAEMRAALELAYREAFAGRTSMRLPAGLPQLDAAMREAGSAGDVHDLRTIEPDLPRPSRVGVTTAAGRSVVASRGPAGEGAPGARLAKRRVLRFLYGAIALLLLGGLGVGASVLVRPRAIAESATSASLSNRSGERGGTSNPEAASLYQAAVQLYREGSTDRARVGFDRASRLDETFAEAHLRYVMLEFYMGPAAQEHYQKAVQFRAKLAESDRLLLDAYEPSLRVAPDVDESARRLAELTQRDPLDSDVLIFLARVRLQTSDVAGALEACDRALQLDPNLPTAALHRAYALMRADRPGEARRAYEKCLELSPTATSCLRDLSDLMANGGECAQAEGIGRRLIAIDSSTPDWFQHLARALYAQAATAEPVLAAFQQKWNKLASTERRWTELRDLTYLDIVTGSFDRALQRLDDWEREIAGSLDERVHAVPARMRMLLHLELGQTVEAGALASAYLKSTSAWTPNKFFDYRITALQVRYLSGAMTKVEFEKARDSWLVQSESDRRGTAALRWVEGYAVTARTPEDAQAALAAIPASNPFKELVNRDVEFEDAAGYVYTLAGQYEAGVAHLRRGAQSCTAIEFPTWHTLANLHLGVTLEKVGDVDGACHAYGVVRKRWGAEERSVSARLATSRMETLRCRD